VWTKSNYFVGERRARVDVVELLGEHGHEQDDDAEQDGKPEDGGVHAVERDALVVVPKQRRVRHHSHHEVDDDRTPDEQVVDARPEVCLQATLCIIPTTIIIIITTTMFTGISS